MPIQPSKRTFLYLIFALSMVALAFLITPGIVVSVALASPLIVAMTYRKRVVAAPVLRNRLVRAPIFVLIVAMFLMGLSGPFLAILEPDSSENLMDVGMYTVVMLPAMLIASTGDCGMRLIELYFECWVDLN